MVVWEFVLAKSNYDAVTNDDYSTKYGWGDGEPHKHASLGEKIRYDKLSVLGPVQSSNFTCAEPNTNLGRPK